MVKNEIRGDNRKMIEVCFSPKLFSEILLKDDYIVVVVDVFRATTSICTAFEHGAKSVVTVAGVKDAPPYREKGYVVAGERDGKIIEGADFGNSPFNFSKQNVDGKDIVITTTNGTQAVEIAKQGNPTDIVFGSFLNLRALGNWLTEQNKNIVILCAAWKNKFNLEDSIYAGALVDYLSNSLDFNFNNSCDSAMAAQDLWLGSKDNLVDYIEKSSHRNRLREMMLDDVIEYCLTLNTSKKIPVLRGDKFVAV